MRKLSTEEIKSITLELMDHIHTLCETNGIEYYLFYGTLIGAVRHRGFIPWDDDFDIAMTRDNYENFCNAVNSDNNDRYKLCNRANTENYYYGIARYSDTRYKYETELPKIKAFDNGIFIDIYPLDNFGNTIEEAEHIKKKCLKLNTAYMIYLNKESVRGGVRSIGRAILHYYYKAKYGKDFNKKIDNRILLEIQKLTSNENSQIGLVCWDSTTVPYAKENLEKRIKCRFEDREYWIPADYDALLTKEYGEYMKYPPEEERHATHDYSIYEKDLIEI